MKLLDATKLARELGVSRWVTSGAKKAGAWRGRYTTLREFEEWRMANPDFVASHFRRKTNNPVSGPAKPGSL